MKYLCVHCDQSFVHEGNKKPRCPECMRVNGLEEVVETATRPAKLPPWALWVGAGAILVGAGIAYSVWAEETPDSVGDEVPMRPLDRAGTRGHLQRLGVDAREMTDLLLPDDAVESWAETASDGEDGAEAAPAILRAIRARASANAFEDWSFGLPRETTVVPPAALLPMLAEDDARHHLYPLEVAALMTSALRSRDATAMVAEAIAFPGDRRPPDPSGQLGYFVVAVYPGDEATGDPTYYDPYEGREVEPSEARVLTDIEAIGAALGHRSLHLLARESDPERALEAIDFGLRLDPRSPSNRAIRGAVLLVAGRGQEALQEVEAAKQLRNDSARRYLVATLQIQLGELDTASRELNTALETHPDFAAAHAVLGAIHLARQDIEEGRAELDVAQRLDPDLHILPELWVQYYVMTGDIEEAVTRAQHAVELNPGIQTRLVAARIYRAAERFTLMRREAHEILERAPPGSRAQYEMLIRQMLGPTALDPLDEEEELTDDELDELADEGDDGEGVGGDGLNLGSPEGGGDLNLGGGGETSGPSLLGEDERLGGGGGGLQLGGGEDDGFQLGGRGGGGPSLLNE